jgi:hypothetical protein
MQNKKIKFSLSLVLWAIVLMMVGLFMLGKYDETFNFNTINIGSYGDSQTREEAIRRKTLVADLVTPTNPYFISKTHGLYVQSAWIEKPWREGFWYWTTNIDSISDDWFEVTIIRKKIGSDTTVWPTINKGKDTSTFGNQLVDDNQLGRLEGTLRDLPSSDTLRYTVLKRDTIDFRPNNIEGTLILILKRH